MIKITRIDKRLGIKSETEYARVEINHNTENDTYNVIVYSENSCGELISEGKLSDVLNSIETIKRIESIDKIYEIVIEEN